MRRTRPKYREFTEYQKMRHKAVSYLTVYVKRGKIKKGNCEVCSSDKNVEAHHDDYSKPLDVRWLCRKHHRELHKNLKK